MFLVASDLEIAFLTKLQLLCLILVVPTKVKEVKEITEIKQQKAVHTLIIWVSEDTRATGEFSRALPIKTQARATSEAASSGMMARCMRATSSSSSTQLQAWR